MENVHFLLCELNPFFWAFFFLVAALFFRCLNSSKDDGWFRKQVSIKSKTHEVKCPNYFEVTLIFKLHFISFGRFFSIHSYSCSSLVSLIIFVVLVWLLASECMLALVHSLAPAGVYIYIWVVVALIKRLNYNVMVFCRFSIIVWLLL